MKNSKYQWVAVFLNLSFWFAMLFAVVGALVRGIWPPLYGWLVSDIWQWEPFGHWLRYVLLGAMGGVVAGASFTNYAWLMQTHVTLLKKIIITTLVILTCIVILVVVREYAGQFLPS